MWVQFKTTKDRSAEFEHTFSLRSLAQNDGIDSHRSNQRGTVSEAQGYKEHRELVLVAEEEDYSTVLLPVTLQHMTSAQRHPQLSPHVQQVKVAPRHGLPVEGTQRSMPESTLLLLSLVGNSLKGETLGLERKKARASLMF